MIRSENSRISERHYSKPLQILLVLAVDMDMLIGNVTERKDQVLRRNITWSILKRPRRHVMSALASVGRRSLLRSGVGLLATALGGGRALADWRTAPVLFDIDDDGSREMTGSTAPAGAAVDIRSFSTLAEANTALAQAHSMLVARMDQQQFLYAGASGMTTNPQDIGAE